MHACTSNCKDGIIAAKKRYGYCFRSFWFNTSSTAAALSPSYLSSSVLQSCDIDLPGACEGLIGSTVSSYHEDKHLSHSYQSNIDDDTLIANLRDNAL